MIPLKPCSLKISYLKQGLRHFPMHIHGFTSLLKTWLPVPIIFIFACPSLVLSQNTDSLLRALKTAPDTQKVNIYLRLADEYSSASKYDEAENYFRFAEKSAADLKQKEFSFRAALRYSWFFYRRGDFPKSIHKTEEALAIATANKNAEEQAEAINLIGMNKGRLGNFRQALEYYQQALPVFEKSGNAKMLGMVYTNIAGVYFDQVDYAMAIDYFKKALELAKKRNNKKLVGSTLNNIAAALQNLQKYEEAKDYYLQAVQLNKESHNMGNLAYNYMNLAAIELEEKNLQGALQYNKMAGEIFRREGDKYSIVQILSQEADLDLAMGKKQQAIATLEKAIQIADSTGSPLLAERTLRALAGAYSASGDFRKATLTYERYIETKDSIINNEVRNAVTKNQMQYEFDKQLLADSLQAAAKENFYKQEIATREKEAGMQRMLFFISIGAFALMLGLAVVIYRSNRASKKAGRIIARQKEEVEQQKLFLEIKNKEILDSITYAKSIQEAILPNEKMMRDILKEYFILFRPRDIVSGDFYWAIEKNNKTFIAVADCTGHGVPGAFMSMLGVSLLNEIVMERGVEDPASIMEILRARVIQALKQEESGNRNKDGMDISLCRIDRSSNTITFCSAVLKVLFWSQGELKIIKGDKQPIGLHGGNTLRYTNHSFDYRRGDVVYMMSDGFADQFGGSGGKKFKFRPLYELLRNHCSLAITEQKTKIASAFEAWKSGHEQVDDVCVIGVQL